MASIEHRPHPTRPAWRVRYRDGKTNRAVTFNTAEQAARWRTLLEAVGPRLALDALRQPIEESRLTVSAHVAAYIDARTGLEPGTASDYRAYLARDIDPTIGALPLALLDRDTIARWVNDMSTQGKAGKSIRNRHSLLSAALTDALRKGLIPVHPSKGMRMPNTSHLTEEMVILTSPEFATLVTAMPEHWRALTQTLASTGIRWGEATALTVADLDLARGEMRIRRAWKHTDGNGHKLGAPKSRRSVRTATFSPALAAILAPLVTGRGPGEFVFTNTRGDVVRHQAYHGGPWTAAVRVLAGDTYTLERTTGRSRRVWTPGPGKRPRIHDLRHTYASTAIRRGIPLTTIQRQMGHESIQTTSDTYGHLVRSDFDALADVGGVFLALD